MRGRDLLAAALAAALLLLLSLQADAMFVIEKGGLKITFPPDAKSKYAGGFDMSLANFGAPKYGGALMGKLIYVDKEYHEDFTCSPPCRYACQDFSKATPKLDLRVNSKETYIMLVDRGPTAPLDPCKFAEKVWNAQGAGAKGVIVVNYEDKLTTMEAPDSDDEANYKYLANITVPATFITKSSGDILKGLLKAGQQVYVSMDWTDALPKKQQVSWEFWTNSNDQCGPVCDVQKEFIKEMVPVAKEFDQHGWTVFTPHYIVWICPPSYRDTPECHAQCIRSGRYCSPDPDGNLKEGYSGADVVQENLRELCFFKLANATGKPWLWWDFVTRFGQQCDMETKKYGQNCSEAVFTQIASENGNFTTLEALRDCIGKQDDDRDHPVMEDQLASQRGDSAEGEVFILPTIRINQAQYRGKLAVAEVLRAICAGFVAGNQPQACNRVIDDACMQGGKGYQDCSSRPDGKTQCINTFTGWNCTCGTGFISRIDPTNGTEVCLDINECLSVSTLDANCTCPRCACKNTRGGYQCITDLPDECAKDNGGCWRGEYKIKGQAQSFSACQDNIAAYKDALAHNQPVDSVPLHTCACPPCFSAVERGGKVSCEPKCDLQYCDLPTGICHLPPEKAGLGAVSIVMIVLAVLAVVAGGAFAVYRWRLRGMMQAEVRAIMAQYMPLGDMDGKVDSAAPPGI